MKKYKDCPKEKKRYFVHDGRYFCDLEKLFFDCKKEGLPIPHEVYGTTIVKPEMDARYIAENACEDMHIDAFDSIEESDIKELQDFLDKWCDGIKGAWSYETDYDCVIDISEEMKELEEREKEVKGNE